MYGLPKEIPKTIQGLIDLAHVFGGENSDLLSIIKAYKIWPAIQMKKFPGNDGLIMLYNTYTRIGVEDFADLYNQCRSVVIHMPTAHIVAAARPIPKRVSIAEARNVVTISGTAEVSYEGTNILVYNHFAKWYFSTTACPSMDYSYFTRDKSHGAMFDEALSAIGLNRAALTEKLDPKEVYSFTLVHHKNNKYTNYNSEFSPEYAKLILAGGTSVDIQGIEVPRRFETIDEAVGYLETTPHAFGVIAASAAGAVKITNDTIIKREEVHAGSDNIWFNLLHVYMLNRDDYKIDDYVREYLEPLTVPTDAEELIAEVFNIIGDKIYEYYKMTTNFTPGEARYTMAPIQVALDRSLSQTMRFQLAQLRVLQTRQKRDEYITREFVDEYLRHYRLTREISKLIKHIASYAAFQNNLYQFSAIENMMIIRLGNYLYGGYLTKMIH